MASLQLPSGLKVCDQEESQAVGMPKSDRVKAILNVVAAVKLKEKGIKLGNPLPFSVKKDLLKNVFCDVSQNPKRSSFTNSRGVTGCLATSTALYSFGHDRIVLPVELAMFQGHRRGFQYPSSISSNQIRDLAGEGMCLPCLGTIIWCMYLTKGFP